MHEVQGKLTGELHPQGWVEWKLNGTKRRDEKRIGVGGSPYVQYSFGVLYDRACGVYRSVKV